MTLVGALHPGVHVRGDRLAVGVPGTHHGGIDEFIGALRGHEQLAVMKLDADLVPRHHVPHVHAEDVGSFLFEERRALAGRDRLLELLLRLLPFADPGPDALLADLQRHAVHGSTGGSRKDVAGVDGPAPLVFINLGDHDVRDDPRDVDADLRLLERQPVDRRVAVLHEEIRRERSIRGLLLRCLFLRCLLRHRRCRREHQPETQKDSLP